MINEQESLNSIIPYRFEEEDYEHTYILEDFYCTNPFCDCQHVTLSFSQQDNPNNQISFLLNFDKTQGQLPNQKKYTKVQSNYMEFFPQNSENLNFSCEEEKYFAEDSYELDSRVDNRDVKLVFYPFELDEKNLKPIFTYTFYVWDFLFKWWFFGVY